MNNLNLVKLLKGCEGVKLWTDFGVNCILEKITPNNGIKVRLIDDNNGSITFFSNGKYLDYKSCRCMLWPSETCRDWSKFKKRIDLKDGDWVVCYMVYPWFFIRKYKCNGMCYSQGISDGISWKYIIPFKDFDPTLSREQIENLSII